MISMAVLALPVKFAALAALVRAPLVRSSMPRAVAARAISWPASTTSVPEGEADRAANSTARGSDIRRSFGLEAAQPEEGYPV